MGYNPNFRGNSASASRQLQTGYQNGTAYLIPHGTPVSTNTNGQISFLDITDENSVFSFVGVAAADIPSGANGTIVSGGRLENIPNSFNIGDPVYAAPGNTLTNVKPNLGVGGFATGNFIVFIGVVVQNEFNSSQLDIQLMISIVGQL